MCVGRDRPAVVQGRAGFGQHVAINARLQRAASTGLGGRWPPVFQSTISARRPGSSAIRSYFASTR